MTMPVVGNYVVRSNGELFEVADKQTGLVVTFADGNPAVFVSHRNAYTWALARYERDYVASQTVVVNVTSCRGGL